MSLISRTNFQNRISKKSKIETSNLSSRFSNLFNRSSLVKSSVYLGALATTSVASYFIFDNFLPRPLQIFPPGNPPPPTGPPPTPTLPPQQPPPFLSPPPVQQSPPPPLSPPLSPPPSYPLLCTNDCIIRFAYPNGSIGYYTEFDNGICSDGGDLNSQSMFTCDFGTDCEDCGGRVLQPPFPPLPPTLPPMYTYWSFDDTCKQSLEFSSNYSTNIIQVQRDRFNCIETKVIDSTYVTNQKCNIRVDRSVRAEFLKFDIYSNSATDCNDYLVINNLYVCNRDQAQNQEFILHQNTRIQWISDSETQKGTGFKWCVVEDFSLNPSPPPLPPPSHPPPSLPSLPSLPPFTSDFWMKLYDPESSCTLDDHCLTYNLVIPPSPPQFPPSNPFCSSECEHAFITNLANSEYSRLVEIIDNGDSDVCARFCTLTVNMTALNPSPSPLPPPPSSPPYINTVEKCTFLSKQDLDVTSSNNGFQSTDSLNITINGEPFKSQAIIEENTNVTIIPNSNATSGNHTICSSFVTSPSPPPLPPPFPYIPIPYENITDCTTSYCYYNNTLISCDSFLRYSSEKCSNIPSDCTGCKNIGCCIQDELPPSLPPPPPLPQCATTCNLTLPISDSNKCSADANVTNCQGLCTIEAGSELLNSTCSEGIHISSAPKSELCTINTTVFTQQIYGTLIPIDFNIPVTINGDDILTRSFQGTTSCLCALPLTAEYYENTTYIGNYYQCAYGVPPPTPPPLPPPPSPSSPIFANYPSAIYEVSTNSNCHITSSIQYHSTASSLVECLQYLRPTPVNFVSYSSGRCFSQSKCEKDTSSQIGQIFTYKNNISDLDSYTPFNNFQSFSGRRCEQLPSDFEKCKEIFE
jgi:hypothetical protein